MVQMSAIVGALGRAAVGAAIAERVLDAMRRRGGEARAAWPRCQRGEDSVPALYVLLTLHAELWMRAHAAVGAGAG